MFADSSKGNKEGNEITKSNRVFKRTRSRRRRGRGRGRRKRRRGRSNDDDYNHVSRHLAQVGGLLAKLLSLAICSYHCAMPLPNSKFQLLPSPLAPSPQKPRASPAVPRANTIRLHTRGGRALQVPIAKTIRKRPLVPIKRAIRKTKPNTKTHQLQFKHNRGPSIMNLLGAHAAEGASETSGTKLCVQEMPLREPNEPIENTESYIQKLQKDITSGRLVLGGNPWVMPKPAWSEAARINVQRAAAGERGINAHEALQLVIRPSVFVWAPEKLEQGLHIHCPKCNNRVTNRTWGRTRVLHHVAGQSLYVSTSHTCYRCSPATAKNSREPRARTTFSADAACARGSFPRHVQEAWRLNDTGQTLCDLHLVDFVRASATKSSWSSIAAVVNEAKTTAWAREVTLRYLRLCEDLRLVPENTPSVPPAAFMLQAKVCRNLFIVDFRNRETEMSQELAFQTGDDVLVVDWTESVAARCGGNFMFNAMDGSRKVLASAITTSSSPYEVEALMQSLQRRGTNPKVIYVDDECCGAWKGILQSIWPRAAVRLDGLHAIMRLTSTTTSPKHPWHGAFCMAISRAIYTYDEHEIRRTRRHH